MSGTAGYEMPVVVALAGTGVTTVADGSRATSDAALVVIDVVATMLAVTGVAKIVTEDPLPDSNVCVAGEGAGAGTDAAGGVLLLYAGPAKGCRTAEEATDEPLIVCVGNALLLLLLVLGDRDDEEEEDDDGLVVVTAAIDVLTFK